VFDRIGISEQVKRKISTKSQSAGVLLFRKKGEHLEVVLGHPGGPFWTKRDFGAWSIPKGLIKPKEVRLEAALREFTEETGYTPRGKFISLGEAKQPGGKIVHVWAVDDDWDTEKLVSNTFEMEWPPRSGRRQNFPELDRANWFGVSEARMKILAGQETFIDRLIEAIDPEE
jgi:predicted NUDIX family NTP pyrophosphohydrolase